MGLLTLNQVAKGPASRVSGLVPFQSNGNVTASFSNYVNDACRQLMRRASYWGTVQPMEGCIIDGCVVWPRTVASVLAVNVCRHPVDIRNFWYRFLNYDRTFGDFQFWHWGHHMRIFEFDGTTPVNKPIFCSSGMFILLFPGDPTDVGKNVTIYGIDGNGQMIRTQRSDGTIQDGVQMQLALPSTQSPFFIRRIDRVVKDQTNFPVRAFQWDGRALNPDGSKTIVDVAVWDAGDISPDYIHSRINRHICPSATCNTKITALVKLAFVPAVFNDDLVIIENQDALRDMIIAIRKKEAGDIATSIMYEKTAIRELNFESQQRWPYEQTSVSFRPFGHDSLNRVLTAVNRG